MRDVVDLAGLPFPCLVGVTEAFQASAQGFRPAGAAKGGALRVFSYPLQVARVRPGSLAGHAPAHGLFGSMRAGWEGHLLAPLPLAGDIGRYVAPTSSASSAVPKKSPEWKTHGVYRSLL